MDKSVLLSTLQFCIDRVMEDLKAQNFGCVLLVDMHDWRFSNVSKSVARKIISLIQARLLLHDRSSHSEPLSPSMNTPW